MSLNVFQLFGDELKDNILHVAILEYMFNLTQLQTNFSKKERNGIEYYRVGIKHNIENLKKSNISQYIHFFEKLNRDVVCISEQNIRKIVTPNQALINIIRGKNPS